MPGFHRKPGRRHRLVDQTVYCWHSKLTELVVCKFKHERVEDVVGRISKKTLSEKDCRSEVLKRLLNHDALSACETRDDLELIARMSIPDELWEQIEGWSSERSCGCGEALWRVYDELQRAHLLEMVTPKLDAIVLDKDGKWRADADQRMDLVLELAAAENPERMAMFNAVVAPAIRSLPVDENGKLSADGFQGYLAGLDTIRLTKAFRALAEVRSFSGRTGATTL